MSKPQDTSQHGRVLPDALDYWWRLIKLTAGSLAAPLALYLLLLWTGVLK